MLPDYYYILQIDVSADEPTIKAAYRRRAKECHPDRGGRHEEMVLVNEAWEILGDPALRQRYDTARQGTVPQPDAPIGPDMVWARARAAVYPTRWVEFERWLDKAAQDFQAVEWTTTKTMFGEIPESRRSASAKLFVFTGAMIGGLCGFFIHTTQPFHSQHNVAPAAGYHSGLVTKSGGSPSHLKYFPRGVGLPQSTTERSSPARPGFPWSVYLLFIGGAWVGKWIHGTCSRWLSVREKKS